MRAFAWACLLVGMLLAVAAFVITANLPTVNPWLSLLGGFCLTAFGIVLLAIQAARKR
jgi:hypothetical protein